MKKVAFVGATGMLGKPVVLELLRAGFHVRALVRNISEARKILPIAIELIEGDLQTEKGVGELLKGMDALYLNLSVKPSSKENDFQPEREGLKNILLRAKEADIKRVIYLSSLVHRYDGFNWWVFQLKRQAVTSIKESGIPFTIFYPSTFMETFETGGYRRGDTINLAGESTQALWFIAGSDYGKTVARSLATPSAANKDFSVQGPESMTTEKAVGIYIMNYKKKLKSAKVPLFLLKLIGTFNPYINYGWHIIEALNNYPEIFESEETWKLLHKPEVTISSFAKSQ